MKNKGDPNYLKAELNLAKKAIYNRKYSITYEHLMNAHREVLHHHDLLSSSPKLVYELEESIKKAKGEFDRNGRRELYWMQNDLTSLLKGRKTGRIEINGFKELSKYAAVVLSGILILVSLFFFSSNFTGNAVGNLSTQTTSFLGLGLLIIGLITGFCWFNSKKKKVEVKKRK